MKEIPASGWNETDFLGKINSPLRCVFVCLTSQLNIVFLTQSFVYNVIGLKKIIWKHSFPYNVSDHQEYGSSVGLKVLDLLLKPLQLGRIISDTCRLTLGGPDLEKRGFTGQKSFCLRSSVWGWWRGMHSWKVCWDGIDCQCGAGLW